MKLEKAVGEPCVEQERCSQPPRPWIVKHMCRGGFKNTSGLLPFGAALVSFCLRDVAGPVSARGAARPGEEHGEAP